MSCFVCFDITCLNNSELSGLDICIYMSCFWPARVQITVIQGFAKEQHRWSMHHEHAHRSEAPKHTGVCFYGLFLVVGFEFSGLPTAYNHLHVMCVIYRV